MSLRFRDVMSSFVSRGGCTETCVEDPLDAESGNLRWSDDADNAAALEDGRGASPAGLCWEHESGDNVLPLHSDGDPPREPLALHIRSELSAVGSPASLKERVPSSPGILTDGGSRGEVQYNTESKNAHVVPPASWSVEDTTHPIFSPGCGVLNNNDASFRSFFHTDPPPAMYDHWDTEVSSMSSTVTAPYSRDAQSSPASSLVKENAWQ